MTEELLTRIRKGILDYQALHNCTKADLAEHFVRSIVFSPRNKAFRLLKTDGWKVVEEIDDPFDENFGEIVIHEFETKVEAEAKFGELYPNGAKKGAKRYLMYQSPISLTPAAGGQDKSAEPLVGKDDADAVEIIVEKGKENVVIYITKIMNHLKNENETGMANTVIPKTMDEAVSKAKSLQNELEKERGKVLFSLLSQDSTTGQKYIISEESWKNQNMAKKGEKLVFPDLSNMPPFTEKQQKKKTGGITYGFLLEFDRFLSGKLGASVGLVLSKAHPILAVNFNVDPNWRESISGSPKSEGSTERENFNFGKHLGSNLKEMIDEMANNGFDVQPIFDSRRGGNCIGVVKLSDIVGLLSDMSFELRDDQTVSVLKNYGADKENGLIRPPPPQIDASSDLSVAGNILKHGNEAIIVKYDPNFWFGSEEEHEEIKQILEPGYHIMTAHDIIAYRLIR